MIDIADVVTGIKHVIEGCDGLPFDARQN
jgi:hypothetical protein